MSNLLTLIYHSIGSPSYSNQTRKRNKNISKLEGKKLSLFANHMILIYKMLKTPQENY